LVACGVDVDCAVIGQLYHSAFGIPSR